MRGIDISGLFNFYELVRTHPRWAWFFIRKQPGTALNILLNRIDIHIHDEGPQKQRRSWKGQSV